MRDRFVRRQQDDSAPAADTRPRNRLLGSLSAVDFDRLMPLLRPHLHEAGEVMVEPGRPIATVFFPETTLVSFVSPSAVELELGIVGFEGVVGSYLALGVDQVPLRAKVQLPGRSLAAPAAAISELMGASAGLRDTFAKFSHVLTLQVASTAYANAHFTVEQRLARWLLMAHDRLQGDDIQLTHETLATMLCVRRPGVTVATHMLEGMHAIRARRGRITVTDRDKLTVLAGDSYGVAEAEYERILGASRPDGAAPWDPAASS